MIQIEIDKLLVESELYPRNAWDWMTVAKYADAMKSGAKFPPILVGKFEGKYYIVDGVHRTEAYKNIGKKTISAELKNYKSRNDMYLDAVKTNSTHGRPFSIQERAQIAIRLQVIRIPQNEIAKLISIRVEKVNSFVKERSGSVETGGKNVDMIFKAPLKHLAGTEITMQINEGQKVMAATNQVQLLDSLIFLLESKSLDMENESIPLKLAQIKKLIGKMI